MWVLATVYSSLNCRVMKPRTECYDQRMAPIEAKVAPRPQSMTTPASWASVVISGVRVKTYQRRGYSKELRRPSV